MTRQTAIVLGFTLLFVPGLATAADPLPLRNWTVASRSGGAEVGAMADLSGGAIFIAVTPCRVVDTRNADGTYGGPIMNAGQTRTFDIDAGPCAGIPNGAAAFSLNFGVTQTGGAGFLTAWNAGGSQPTVATATWFGSGQTLSTAAVVPGSGAGAISVYVAATTHVTIDVNGYFLDAGGDLNDNVQFSLWGNVAGGSLIRGRNLNTTSTSSVTASLAGVISTSQDGPTAIWAEQASSSGANHALHANNRSVGLFSSAVHARAGTATWDSGNAATAGVHAFSAGSAYSVGMYGEAVHDGVVGVRVDTSGNDLTRGDLGSSGTDGVYSSDDLTIGGTKSFVEPHPTQAGAVIKFVALEGPEAGTYFRGRGRIQAGFAVIDVPDSFRLVSDPEGLTVQITPIGQMANYAVVTADLNRIVVRASKEIEFYYQVNGVRKAFRDFEPIQLAPEAQYFVPRHAGERLEQITRGEEAQKRLIQNGTFHPDGSVNMSTAERLGWAQEWRERDERIRAHQARTDSTPADEQRSEPRKD